MSPRPQAATGHGASGPLFNRLFFKLRGAGIPVSLTEYLGLLDALDNGVADMDIDSFYYLARCALVKDERQFDRFDRVFAAHFKGAEQVFAALAATIPAEWMVRRNQLALSEEERRQIESLGGWEQLMQTLRDRLNEQKKAHAGGSRMMGTGGTSPFGGYGYNPEGVRLGQDASRHGKAVKVWDRREYRALDGSSGIGARNLQLALRRLRRFAREGANEEFDLDGTVRATARKAGLLDIRMVPERHNATKLLLFLDTGGSMERHVQQCEALFSAVRSEFRHLEHFYFHNCPYESVWRDNRRRTTQRTPVLDIMRKFGRGYRLVFIGDASMSPYEIMLPGGSVEHWNDEPGATWMGRLLAAYPQAVWMNPAPEQYWAHTSSIGMLRELLQDRMYPLTLDGLGQAVDSLRRPRLQ